MKLIWFALAACCLCAQTPRVLIENATLIDALGAPSVQGMQVLTQGDRIVSVAKRIRAPKGTQVVDGRGKYLIYGLSDMHVHLRGGRELTAANESWLTLFLVNGVTTIREMGGDLVEDVLKWRAEIAGAKREGPRILTCGPKLDGPRPAWPGSIAIATPAEGRAAVRSVKAMGADFVKVYFANVSREVHTAILDEAKTLGLAVTGHLPHSLSFREVTQRGQHIEHGYNLVLDGASTRAEEIRAAYPESPNSSTALQILLRRLVDSFDPGLVPPVAAQLKETGTWVTMTLLVGSLRLDLPADNHASHPLRKYLHPGIWKTWDLDEGRRRAPSGDAVRVTRERLRITAAAVPVFHQAGVNMLAGSDCGASNNFGWPGWSLHEELAAFVKAGLTPLDALRLATRAPARHLKEERDRGGIEPGKIADLVLLDANPLADIANTQKIRGVMARGRWHDRETLDGMLKRVEESAARR